MNDTNPKVSVIVCTFNQERYIAEALDSILAQKTDFPFQIVLADDCSTDSTGMICRLYAERYPDKVRYIRNEENKGVARNYFDAIREARGMYIADLAGDDRWTDPDKLQRQADLLDSDPKITICHAAWEMFTDDGRVFPSEVHWMPRKEEIVEGRSLLPIIVNHKKEERFIHLCTAMYRRDTTIQLMREYPGVFDEVWLPCEDFQLILLLAARGKVACQPQKVLQYRVGNVSVSSTENARKTVNFTGRVMFLTLRLARMLAAEPDYLDDYFRKTLHYVVMTAFNSGDSEALDESRRIADIHTARPMLKTRIALMLSSNRIIWKISRGLRRLLNQK